MAEARALDWRALRVVALALLAVKLVLLFTMRPFMDETYYFIWGQHPALSYFDHPPLIGWTQALSAAIFGWNVVSLRAMVVLTLAGDLVLLALFARQRTGEAWQSAFWPSAALFLTVPILFGLSSVALPDHLLVLFSLLAVYAVERFVASRAAGATRWRWLYLAAVAVGLATLSKYTGALLGLALAIYVLAVPALRPLFRSSHLYLAAALAVVLQGPVLAWNLQHHFASFGFIVGGRGALPNPLSFGGVGGFILGAALVLSPFLLWALVQVLRPRNDGHGFARIVFWASTLGFLVASLFTNILIHWNVIAYVAVLPLLASALRPRLLFGAQLAYGLLAIAVATVNYTALPVLALVNAPDQTSAWSYGWDAVATEIAAAKTAETIGFVAATDYALASPLAFALHDKDVVSLSSRHDAYDDWFVPSAHQGEAALIVADAWRPLDRRIKRKFGSVERLKSVAVSRFGKHIDRYVIYIGRDFLPAPK